MTDWQAIVVIHGMGEQSRHDRLLVGEAVAAGCHVFLTRDKGILRHRKRLAPHIAVLRPTDLLDELALSGELQFPTSSILPGRSSQTSSGLPT